MSEILRREDFRSESWKRLTKHLQERLQQLRESNDAPSFDAEKTALIRGQIKMVKEILDLQAQASSSSPDDDLGNHVVVTPVDWQEVRPDHQ